jgi:CD36 family
VFDTALSGQNLTEADRVHVPNLAFISAIPNVFEMGFFAEMIFKTVVSISKPQQFQTISVKDFLFGFSDDFMQKLGQIKWDFDPKEVSLIGYRDGLLKKTYTVTTGVNDYDGIAQFTKINGKEKDNIWTTDKCNKICGSDLAVYNITSVHNKRDLFIYPSEIHRALAIHYNSSVSKSTEIFFCIKLN